MCMPLQQTPTYGGDPMRRYDPTPNAADVYPAQYEVKDAPGDAQTAALKQRIASQRLPGAALLMDPSLFPNRGKFAGDLYYQRPMRRPDGN